MIEICESDKVDGEHQVWYLKHLMTLAKIALMPKTERRVEQAIKSWMDKNGPDRGVETITQELMEAGGLAAYRSELNKVVE